MVEPVRVHLSGVSGLVCQVGSHETPPERQGRALLTPVLPILRRDDPDACYCSDHAA